MFSFVFLQIQIYIHLFFIYFFHSKYSQYNLALIYLNIPFYIQKAFELFTLSANQDYAPAQYQLAKMYEGGIYIEENIEKAYELYVLSAYQGYKKAQTMLGRYYMYGIVTNKNEKRAFEWITSNVKLNDLNIDSDGLLPYMYRSGKCVEKNIQIAIELLILETYKGYSNAQNDLGIIYKDGEEIRKNTKRATELFKLSADQGNKFAQYNLAMFYKNNINLMDKYIELLILSANQDFLLSKNELILHYENNNNYEKAIYYAKLYNLEEHILRLTEFYKPLIKIFNSDNCTICKQKFIGFKDSILTSKCGHQFHFKCFKQLKNCPSCEFKFNLSEDIITNIMPLEKIYHFDMCTICLEPFIGHNDYMLTINCGHQFHFNCIKKCKNCPFCQSNINIF